MKRILFLSLLLMCQWASAQHKFSYIDIQNGYFAQKTVSGVRSMADGKHYTTFDGKAIVRFSYASGTAVDTLCNVGALTKGLGRAFDYVLSTDQSKIMLLLNRKPIYRRSYTADYYIFDTRTGSIAPLGSTPDIRMAAFSPDGQSVAFVSRNNIYLRNLTTGAERQLTFDGEFNSIINGVPDWVYEEEFELTRCFSFSPDGTRLAYMRFDESQVREFTITRFNIEAENPSAAEKQFGQPLYTQPYTYKYPKAGEKNSIVTLRVINLSDDSVTSVDVGPQPDQYIPYMDWTPAGELYFMRTSRHQNEFDLLLADKSGCSRVIYHETSPRYVERVGRGTVTFLDDGNRFIVMNETATGHMHLYLYDTRSGLVGALTQGDWDVTELVGVDSKRAYYISTQTSSLRRNLFSVSFDGRNRRMLTDDRGFYRVTPSAGCRYFLTYFSNLSTPNEVRLCDNGGKMIRVVEENTRLKERIAKVALPQKQIMTIALPGRDLYAYIIRPSDFDPSRKYPLLITQYCGPGSQQVQERWSVDWEDVLVQEGYIILGVDSRGTGFRGEEFKKCTYGHLGEYETQDLIAVAEYFARQDYIDSARIGIYGWSYGGFTSLNAKLRGGDLFKMAIAVAPVTSWRYYDSIYTEIYNGLPDENPDGYDRFSPINYADRLSGKLLIMHGTADDNVHIQNSMSMVRALEQAGRQFDFRPYPDDNHSMLPSGRHHVRQSMVHYCLENL